MIPLLCQSAFAGLKDCIAPSVERAGTQTQQADLDSGTFEMHHRGLEVSPLFVSIRGRKRGENRPAVSLFDLQR